jgi:hypothetical protein
MSYTLNIFRDLAEKYTSWDELKTYLTSAEGNKMRISSGVDRYAIIRYVKNTSDMTIADIKWFRSIIWDTVTNRPVCVAPPKAATSPIPLGNTGSDIKLCVEDFLDGTMINVFKTIDMTEPVVSTRTLVGADGKFYSNKSFSELFKEALALQPDALSVLDQPSAETPACFASFILQHPEHRVVSRYHAPHIWIVHKGTINAAGQIHIVENFDDVDMPRRLVLPRHPIASFADEKELNSFFDTECVQRGWYTQGLTFKDGTGNRWRMRNPNYMTLRALRGSEAAPVDRFLRLRSESKVTEYLRHYSEDRDVFWTLEQKLRDTTKMVFDAYCDVHKVRSKKLADIAWAMRPCVFKLHSHYLEHLKPNGGSVKMNDAVALVNNMAVYEQKRLVTDAQAPVVASADVAASSPLPGL